MEKFSTPDQFYQVFAGKKIALSSPGVSHLLKALANDDLTFEQLAIVLERFPSVAIKIIALANSAWSTPLEPITTVEAACSRLGTNIVKSVSIALAVSAPFNTSLCPSFNAQQFWTDTMLTAEAASLLVPVINKSRQILGFSEVLDSGTTRTAALLSTLGLLFIVHYYHQQAEAALKRKDKDVSTCLRQHCFDLLGIYPSDAGRVMAEELTLPAILTCAMTANMKSGSKSNDWPTIAVVALSRWLITASEAEDIPESQQPYELQESLSPPLLSFGDALFSEVLNEKVRLALFDDLGIASRSVVEVAKSIKW